MLIFSALFVLGVCQKQHKLLTKAIIEARDKGMLLGFFLVEFYQFKMYCCLFVNVA